VAQEEVRRVGEQVRLEREKAGLSIAQLAQAAGLSKAYVVRLENAGTNPSLGVLGQIANALDITVADLVRGPAVRYEGDESELPPSLRLFADEASLTSAEVRTLSSIRWRRGEQPHTSERWRYIYDSLRLSRSMEAGNDGD
jgi:transcriptional regulator with XRE-family HTH domain